METSAQSSSLVTVDVVRSARRRNLAIHVNPQGKVEVRAPLAASARAIAEFLDRHRDWVLRKVAEADASPPWQPAWGVGGQWLWRGEPVVLAPGGPRGGRLFDDQLALPLRHDDEPGRWREATFRWHRRAAEELLATRAAGLFQMHCGEHRLARVELRWMRATWGTCSGRRATDRRRDVVLRLNPWLASLPPALCDAILLHELAHVEHMNHGPAFYRRLGQLNPDWKAQDRELRLWARRLFPLIDA